MPQPLRALTQHPRNVQAVFKWLRAHRPDLLPNYEDIFDLNRPSTSMLTNHYDALAALVLQGFEAGRDFQREHPEVKSYIPTGGQ